jgi:hypothetical protein
MIGDSKETYDRRPSRGLRRRSTHFAQAGRRRSTHFAQAARGVRHVARD